jgi:hypothetical protein
MNLKALFAATVLSMMATVAIADDKKADEAKPAEAKAEVKADAKADAKPADAKKEEKVELKADADAEVKTAIEAATAANSAAKKAGFEWYWKDKPASKHLEDAIIAANDGKKEDALKLAKTIENAGKQGQEQAEKAKTAGPDTKAAG